MNGPRRTNPSQASHASNGPWLLVGLSVRPLAEAAAAAGHDICAIDAFADRETLAACAGRVVKLPVDGDWRIGVAGLARVLGEARRRYAPAGFAGIVACSGFEAEPELLDLLNEAAPLLGNDAATVRAVREPHHWFALLERIGAPYPAVAFDPPNPRGNWLVKSAAGSGGRLVKAWRDTGRAKPLAADAYFQRRAAGRPASALFLADGRNACVIGWQWQMLAPTRERPWRYGGVITAPDMAASVRQRVAAIVAAITRETGLRGLCGLDFLVDGERAHMLELNPRPTASVALYAHRDPDLDLFALHRNACAGMLPAEAGDDADLANVAVTGESVLYAPAALTIPPDFPWPGWCRDLPVGTARPGADEPVCSIRANGATPATVSASLTHRLHTLTTELMENRSNESKFLERQRPHHSPSPVAAG